MKHSTWLIVAGAAVFGLLGCAPTQEKPGTTADPTAATKLSDCRTQHQLTERDIDSITALSDAVIGRLDLVLDCFFGPTLDGTTPTKQDVKNLRGHMITTVISRYALFNLTGQIGDEARIRFRENTRMQQDATDALVSIARAEKGYRRAATNVFDVPAASSSPLRDAFPNAQIARDEFDRVARITYAAAAFADAATPSLHRGQSIIENFLSVVAAPTPSTVKALLRDVLTTVESFGVLTRFTGSYREDIRNRLTCAQQRSPSNPQPNSSCGASLKADWQIIDVPLKDACDRIAAVADVDHTCLAGTYKP